MSITQKPFGIDQIGRPMTLYTMTNKNGAEVSVLDYGGHIVSVKMPDRKGETADVVLGFDELSVYEGNHASIGATIGRYANRIGNARFTLNGQEYTLFPNDHGNSLHGGRENFQFKWFKAETLETENEDAVLMTYVAHDGEEGYPGKLRLQVTFALDSRNTLTIRYLAETDKDTVVNFTNHSYFNLAGKGDILHQTIRINAPEITETDDLLIPTGRFQKVEGTPLDLRKDTTVAAGLARRADCHEIDNVNGYDFNYCVPGEGVREMAVLYDEDSGRRMRVLSDQPGIQLYTGQGLNITGHGGAHYGSFAGLALETQHYADSPNHENFPSTVLHPGEAFQSVTMYAFDVL